MTSVNPYAAPKAAVADQAVILDGEFIPGGRSTSAGRGWAWIVDAWKLVLQQLWLWIGIMLLMSMMLFAVALIPFVGAILQVLFWPVLVAGIVIGCAALDRGEKLELNHLFAGFQQSTGTLIGVGALSLLGTLFVMLIVAVIMGASLFTVMAGVEDPTLVGTAVLLSFLLFLALLLPVIMATWFAPPLVVFHDLGALESIKASFFGCLKNIVPFLIYSVVIIVFMLGAAAVGFGIFAAIGLGTMMANNPAFAVVGGIAVFFVVMLVLSLLLGPVVFASVYTAYRDIYFKPR